MTSLPPKMFLMMITLCLLVTCCFTGESSVDKDMARFAFEELSKDSRTEKVDDKIKSFVYQKAKQIAQMNKKFAADVSFTNLEGHGEVDYHLLDSKYLLITLETSMGAYQGGGCLFLVNKETYDWQPVLLNYFDENKPQETYSVAIDNIDYNAPILQEWSRSSGWYGGLGTQFSYVFQDGRFTLIRMVNNFVNEQGMDKIEKNPEMSPDEVIIETVPYINSHISKLFQKFASKKHEKLNQLAGWKRIFFVSKDKVNLHEKPEDEKKMTLDLVRGDALFADRIQKKWLYVKYMNPTTNQTVEGWVKLEDVTNLDVSNDEVDTLKL